MESAPSFGEVVRQWVADPFWIVLLVAMAGAYGLAFRKSRQGKFRHPSSRLALFMAGIAVAAIATVSPVAHYSDRLLWVDFTGFLMLTMIAPPLMLLGAPVTLGFRISGPKRRRMLRRMYRSRLITVAHVSGCFMAPFRDSDLSLAIHLVDG